MRANLHFILALCIIILVSWLDMRYFGFNDTYNVPPLARQAAHNAALTITAVTGFLYYRRKEHWLFLLWNIFYALVFTVVLVSGGIHILAPSFLSVELKGVISETRLLAEGPVPFMVIYILQRLVKRLN